MRRIVFLTMIAVFSAGSLFAQKSALKDAKRSLGRDDLNEARVMIKQASENPETANDPETWKIMGDIGNKAFDNERTKAMLGQKSDDKVMYDGLMESYHPYLKADSLGELPDAKGKVKNKFRKDISSILKANHPFYINGGVYYNEQGNYAKAADFFQMYWDIPTLPMYEGQNAFVLDSTYQTIKYYAIITAIQAEQHERALAMLDKASKEPFFENSAYKESDLYELMASEYLSMGDSAKYVDALYKGAEKYPESSYFVPNLVNVFIRKGDTENAINYLNQAIENNPEQACDFNSVKGILLADKGDLEGAEAEYKKALDADPNCERALENLGRAYIIQAQNVKEASSLSANRQEQLESDKVAVEFYQKSLPHLEKLKGLQEARSASESEVNGVLMLLRNVYYNLSVLGVDKSAELQDIESKLDLK